VKLQQENILLGNIDEDQIFNGVSTSVDDFDLAFHNLNNEMTAGGPGVNSSWLFSPPRLQHHYIGDGGAHGGFQQSSVALQSDSGDSEEEEDEAQKFAKQTINNTHKHTYLQKLNQGNLLLPGALDIGEQDYFGNKTPKVIQSDESDCGEDRPLQLPNNAQAYRDCGLEALLEESREESQRAESGMMVLPAEGAQEEVGNTTAPAREPSPQGKQPQQAQRHYDSDIFVMSNTTFEEEIASLSSRRVSEKHKQAKNEYMNYVNASDEIQQKELAQITGRLFLNQHAQQANQKKRNDRYQQNAHKKSGGSSSLLKQSSSTRFSNYVSVSKDLSVPTIIPSQTAAQSFQAKKTCASGKQPGKRTTRDPAAKKQFNSISSINPADHSKATNRTVLHASNKHSISSSHRFTTQSKLLPPPLHGKKPFKSNSNEALAKEIINASCLLPATAQPKVIHHSPQSSLFMRNGPGLSPVPALGSVHNYLDDSQCGGALNMTQELNGSKRPSGASTRKNRIQTSFNKHLSTQIQHARSPTAAGMSSSKQQDMSLLQNSMGAYKAIQSLLLTKKLNESAAGAAGPQKKTLTRQRSKSEIETVEVGSKSYKLLSTTAGGQSDIRGSQQIHKPYHVKTMAEVNKFCQDSREGCKSVLQKHKAECLAVDPRNMSFDPSAKTFDGGNTRKQKPVLLSDDSCSTGSPLPWQQHSQTDKSR
jgi:hypothetical protein